MAIGLLVMIMMRGAGAQAVPSCITPLMKCTDFLRSTNPSADCCNAVKEAVTKDLPCLCSLLLNKNLINQFNMTRVLELPKYCNITASTSLCGKEKEKTQESVLTIAIFLLRRVRIFFYSRGQLNFFCFFCLGQAPQSSPPPGKFSLTADIFAEFPLSVYSSLLSSLHAQCSLNSVFNGQNFCRFLRRKSTKKSEPR